MFIKVDKNYYSVNISKYSGSRQAIADKVVSDILKRMRVNHLTPKEKHELRSKIYTTYLETFAA